MVLVRTPFHAQNGETFIVTDADKLAEEELPKYAITSETPCLVGTACVSSPALVQPTAPFVLAQWAFM